MWSRRPAPAAANTLSTVGQAETRHWADLSPEAYRTAKEAMGEDVLAKLERRFPGLEAHVRHRSAATPRTMARHTGNPDGAILGFHTSCGVHRRERAVSRPPSHPAGKGRYTLVGEALEPGKAEAFGHAPAQRRPL